MKQLTFICQPFFPDQSSTSQLFSPLVSDLSNSGWGIQVFCGFPGTKEKGRVPRCEVWQGIRIRRCGLRIPVKQSYLHRAVSYFVFLLEVSVRLLFVRQPSIWLGVTNPPFTAHLLAIISLIRRHHFNYFFLDIYPEGLIGRGLLRESSFVVFLWTLINGWAYRRAAKIFVLGRDMIPLLTQRYWLPVEKITYFPHWSAVECDAALPFEQSKFVQEWELKGKFVVQYSGNMGIWNDMESLVTVAHTLRADTEISFVFIGGGIGYEGARVLAKNLELENIQWKNFVPFEDLKHSLAACHVSLVSLSAGLEGVAVPCKLYGILASGRAVVAQVPEKSEVAMCVQENKCGVVTPPGNVDHLKNMLLYLKGNTKITKGMGENAFSAYQEQYTLHTAFVRMKDLLRS